MTTPLEQFLRRAEALLQRVEAVLPPVYPRAPDWRSGTAFRWRKRAGSNVNYLQPVQHASNIALSDLHNVGPQKQQIERNTRQFVQGRPANNVLLTGARGTGKSSLIKACLNEFAADGLRLIEVDKADLAELPDIVDLVAGRPERFIIFCDDLSFEEGEAGYKALKVALDGSIAAQSDNVLIYATSNRRHLLPERMSDNASYKHDGDGDLHPGETVEEKISLSERFGLWLSFYPFKQDDYLAIVGHWLSSLGCTEQQIEAARG
ncbi:MAG TPA: ATP-binding protein, partial [Telluria sp.]